MALLYKADLHPSKVELMVGWLPGCSWFQDSGVDGLSRVAAYRFDDPAGQVGMETILVQAGDGPIYQVPLSYRAAPLAGADDWLIGTTEHSVLGRRWVYDACGDPVYVTALAHTIFNQAGQAEEFFDVDGVLERRDPGMTVTGSGAVADLRSIGSVRQVVADDPTRIDVGALELLVLRRLGDDERSGATLTGSWTEARGPALLAYATPSA